jgi:hypothetical protein
MMNWAHSYEHARKRVEADLLLARSRGMSEYRLSHSTVNPQRLSSSHLAEVARREASYKTERAINIHNEQVERRARR